MQIVYVNLNRHLFANNSLCKYTEFVAWQFEAEINQIKFCVEIVEPGIVAALHVLEMMVRE